MSRGLTDQELDLFIKFASMNIFKCFLKTSRNVFIETDTISKYIQQATESLEDRGESKEVQVSVAAKIKDDFETIFDTTVRTSDQLLDLLAQGSFKNDD